MFAASCRELQAGSLRSPNEEVAQNSLSILTYGGRIQLRNEPSVVHLDQSIAQVHSAACVRSDITFMRNQNDRIAAAVQIFEQDHDLFTSL
jgi:hypothetical protein